MKGCPLHPSSRKSREEQYLARCSFAYLYIPDSINNLLFHIFADDVQIHKSFSQRDFVKSIAEMNVDLVLILFELVCNVCNGLRSAWPHFRNIPHQTRGILAKSLLLPHFDYCCFIYYYGLKSTAKHRVFFKALSMCFTWTHCTLNEVKFFLFLQRKIFINRFNNKLLSFLQ